MLYANPASVPDADCDAIAIDVVGGGLSDGVCCGADGGIYICAGHTNASYQQIVDAAGEGLQGVTHLYNAMSPLTSREPGTVGAALDEDGLWAGIIADGHHVHPASIRLACAAKPEGKLVLVSDAMATVGGHKGSFDLYGEVIRAHEGRLVNSDGALAGSAIGMSASIPPWLF